MNRDYENATDEELIDRLREGENDITDYIIEKYKNLVRKKAKSMFILGADNEDLIQEGMIGLFKAIRDYDAGRDASFLTFADLCVSRQMYTAVQASRREKHSPLNSYVSIYTEMADHGESGEEYGELVQLFAANEETNPEHIMIDQENLEHIQSIISRELSSFEKEVLDLYITGMPYSQIAKVLGRDVKSTDNALQRLKHKIKKAIKGISMLFLALFLCVPIMTKAAEEYETFEVEHAQLLLDIPSDCHILYQEIDEEDSYIDRIGADKEQVEAFFQKSGIVLYGIAEDDSYELVLTLTQNNDVNYIYNMQSLTDSQVEEFAETIETSYSNYGYVVSEHRIYETDQAKYVLIHFSQDDGDKKLFCEQYYTILGNSVYNITMRCYQEEKRSELAVKMKRIVDSIVYSTGKEGVSYKNDYAGIRFELNKGWEQIDAESEHKNVLVQFMHTNGLGESIQIMMVDLWGNMDILHQFTKTRAQIDTQHEMTKREIAEYGSYVKGIFQDVKSCVQEEHNGKWYITNQTPSGITNGKMEDAYYQKSYTMIKNGILYIFQYGFYEGADLHETDFEHLLSQVEFDEAEIMYGDEQIYRNIAKAGYILVAVGVLTVVLLVFITYLYLTGISNQKDEK